MEFHNGKYYFIEEPQRAIKAVQGFLQINKTGEYDDITRGRVRDHQIANSLEATGEVDYETFVSIINEGTFYEKRRAAESALTSSAFPYRTGDYGSDVEIINNVIRDIFSEFTLESQAPSGAYYGKDTAASVRRLSEIFMLTETDEIDALMFHRMLLERNAIADKQKY